FAKLGERIDLLCTSPLVRAVQTAEILAEALLLEEVAVLEELRPEVPVQTLLERVSALQAKHVALVGHDPQMSGVAATLGGVDRGIARGRGRCLRGAGRARGGEGARPCAADPRVRS